jgi:isopropylmalate/homocitrate/citramalate synthase
MNTQVITEISDYIQNETDYQIPPMTPFVGSNFNLTRAGIHADGMMKNPEIYNIFDTGALLNRPPRVSITNTSGVAGIAFWVNEYRKQCGESELSKNDELIHKIYDWVMSQYDEGRVTMITDTELEQKYKEYTE